MFDMTSNRCCFADCPPTFPLSFEGMSLLYCMNTSEAVPVMCVVHVYCACVLNVCECRGDEIERARARVREREKLGREFEDFSYGSLHC